VIGGGAAQTAFDAVVEATAMLEHAGIESARQEAEWLLAAALGVKRFALYLEPRRELSPAEAEGYFAFVRRRAERTPLQHLTGFEDFHGLRLVVNGNVLVPRPETEGLVEWALEMLRRHEPAPRVADIGTGSGAIACALAHGLPAAQVLAIDRSLPALAVASINVRTLGLSRQVKLLAGDLLAPLGARGRRLDLVIANPPYIPSASVRVLPPEVARFDPREALDGGPDGMAVTRRIIMAAPSVLRRGGWLMLEIGEDQAGPLASLMAAEGFVHIEARRDLLGAERYLGGRWADGAVSTRRGTC
jgi:release factor glutamine methyltransferase